MAGPEDSAFVWGNKVEAWINSYGYTGGYSATIIPPLKTDTRIEIVFTNPADTMSRLTGRIVYYSGTITQAGFTYHDGDIRELSGKFPWKDPWPVLGDPEYPGPLPGAEDEVTGEIPWALIIALIALGALLLIVVWKWDTIKGAIKSE